MPFYHISDNDSLEQEILHGTRPTMSVDLKERASKRGLLPHVAALMKDCWDPDPRLRPTAALLSNSIRGHGHPAASPPFNAGKRQSLFRRGFVFFDLFKYDSEYQRPIIFRRRLYDESQKRQLVFQREWAKFQNHVDDEHRAQLFTSSAYTPICYTHLFTRAELFASASC